MNFKLVRSLMAALVCIGLLSYSNAVQAQDAPKEEPKKPEMAPPPPPKKPEEKGVDPSVPQPQNPQRRRGARGNRGGQRGMQRLAEALDLDDEQMQKIQELSQQRTAKMRELMQGGRPSREEFQKLQTEFNDKLKALLTPEQQKKYEEMVANRRNRFGRQGRGRQGRGRQGRGGPNQMSEEQILEQVKKVLVLSETEESVILPKVKTVIASRKSVRQATSEGQQKLLAFLKSGGTAEQVAEKVQEFRSARDMAEKKHNSAMSSLAENLSEEQKAKLVALGLIR